MKQKRILQNKKAYNFVLILIVILAVFIRVFRFGTVPGGFNQDGLMAAVDAKALADHGTDRFGMIYPVHFTAWGYGQMSVLMSYLMIPFIKTFGLSVVTARLPSLLCSLAGLLFLYLFARKCFGEEESLVILAFGAICPWQIMQSRWALDCNLFPHFLMAGCYFLHRAAVDSVGKKSEYISLALSMVLFGLSMYCYGISIYTVPLMLVLFCVVLVLKEKIGIGVVPFAVLVYLLVAWPFIACMVINTFGLSPIETPFFTVPAFPNSVRSSDILFFSENFAETLKRNFSHAFNIIFQRSSDSIWNAIPQFGTLYKFSVVFIIIGLVSLIANRKKYRGSEITGIFLVVALWEGLVTADVNINRFNIVFYPLIILAGLGIYEAISRVRFLWIPVAALYALSFGLFSLGYFTNFADEISTVFLEDFGSAVSSLKGSDAEKIYITADSQYPGSANVSEILTLYYLDIDSEYFCGKTGRNREAPPEIPYSSRFIYKRIGETDANSEGSCAYVVTNEELAYFDQEAFNVEVHGRYYTLTPKAAP